MVATMAAPAGVPPDQRDEPDNSSGPVSARSTSDAIMLTWTFVPFVGVLAVGIGYAVGKLPPSWKTWHGMSRSRSSCRSGSWPACRLQRCSSTAPVSG